MSDTDYTIEEMNRMYEQYLSTPGPTISELKKRAGGRFKTWVYKGLIESSVTFVAGAPEAGKSRLCANLAAAYSKGESFLGVASEEPGVPRNVLILGTEVNLVSEWAERVEALGGDLDRIAVLQLEPGEAVPLDSVERAEYGAIDLVIVDNAAGFADPAQGLNNDVSVLNLRKIIAPYRACNIPVVVIHHTNKTGGLMGSTQYRALARWTLEVRKQSESRAKLTATGNAAASAEYSLIVRHPVVSVSDSEGAEKKRGASETVKTMIELACAPDKAGQAKSVTAARVAEQLRARGLKNAKGEFFTARGIETKLNTFVSSKDSTLSWNVQEKRFTNTLVEQENL